MPNEQAAQPDKHSSTSQPDQDATCDVCGAFGAYHFGDRTLCQNCYEGCGSCCPEFGKDDLWTFPEKDQLNP